MKYNIGDEVVVELIGRIVEIKKGQYNNNIYYVIDAGPEYARVLESKICRLPTPENMGVGDVNNNAD